MSRFTKLSRTSVVCTRPSYRVWLTPVRTYYYALHYEDPHRSITLDIELGTQPALITIESVSSWHRPAGHPLSVEDRRELAERIGEALIAIDCDVRFV